MSARKKRIIKTRKILRNVPKFKEAPNYLDGVEIRVKAVTRIEADFDDEIHLFLDGVYVEDLFATMRQVNEKRRKK